MKSITQTPPQPSPIRRMPHRSLPQSFEPIPFRARPCPAPGTEISRPVPLRTRATSFCTTGVCPGCSGTTPGACRSGTSFSLGELRAPQPHRVVSFGSAITPQSGASTDGEDAPRSWEWPSDDDTMHRRHASAGSYGSRGERRRAMRIRPSSRSDSSSSEADWTGSAKFDRTEWGPRGGSRYRGATTQRSQSALVEPGCCSTPRADGPRPWDMTEGQGKNFASFGFRKTMDRGDGFGDTLSSKHLLKNGVKATIGAVRVEDSQRGGKRMRKFLKRLGVSGLKKNSGARNPLDGSRRADTSAQQ